jgi:hypothetical protein
MGSSNVVGVLGDEPVLMVPSELSRLEEREEYQRDLEVSRRNEVDKRKTSGESYNGQALLPSIGTGSG